MLYDLSHGVDMCKGNPASLLFWCMVKAHGAAVSRDAVLYVQDLPELLGGSAPLVPVEDAVASLNANQK